MDHDFQFIAYLYMRSQIRCRLASTSSPELPGTLGALGAWCEHLIWPRAVRLAQAMDLSIASQC